ncbi:MAG: hypothetical protein ABI304_01605 [Rudaea sp.]
MVDSQGFKRETLGSSQIAHHPVIWTRLCGHRKQGTGFPPPRE